MKGWARWWIVAVSAAFAGYYLLLVYSDLTRSEPAGFALEIVVATKRPFAPSALVGAWTLSTIAVFSIDLPDHIAATWRSLPAVVGLALWVPFSSNLAAAAVMLTFFANFPQQLIRSRAAGLAIWTPMVVLVFLQLRFAARTVLRAAK